MHYFLFPLQLLIKYKGGPDMNLSLHRLFPQRRSLFTEPSTLDTRKVSQTCYNFTVRSFCQNSCQSLSGFFQKLAKEFSQCQQGTHFLYLKLPPSITIFLSNCQPSPYLPGNKPLLEFECLKMGRMSGGLIETHLIYLKSSTV